MLQGKAKIMAIEYQNCLATVFIFEKFGQKLAVWVPNFKNSKIA
jgi:hypothetical protein